MWPRGSSRLLSVMNESDTRSASSCARAHAHAWHPIVSHRSLQALAHTNIMLGDQEEPSAVWGWFPHTCEWSNMLLVIDAGIRPSLPPPTPPPRFLPQSWKRLSIPRLMNAAARPVSSRCSPPASVDRVKNRKMCVSERWCVIMGIGPRIQKRSLQQRWCSSWLCPGAIVGVVVAPCNDFRCWQSAFQR